MIASDEEIQRARLACMAAYDALPPNVRRAIRECLFDVHIMRRLPDGMDCTNLISAVERIKTEADAVEFIRQQAGRWGNSLTFMR